jgi:hypothetical protein
MPTKQEFTAHVADEPFAMRLNSEDYEAFASIVNIGIDSHLESMSVSADNRTGNVEIEDRDSVYTFIRRCTESDNDRALDLASCMMSVLDYEWI